MIHNQDIPASHQAFVAHDDAESDHRARVEITRSGRGIQAFFQRQVEEPEILVDWHPAVVFIIFTAIGAIARGGIDIV